MIVKLIDYHLSELNEEVIYLEAYPEGREAKGYVTAVQSSQDPVFRYCLT